MNDHSHFEELAALEAGGFLSGEELMELREHAKDCVECRNAQEEFSALVCSGLPQTVSPIREFMDEVKTRPDNGIRGRFLQRARLEGIAFSLEVEGSIRHPGRRISLFVPAATALVTAIIAAIFFGTYWHPAPPGIHPGTAAGRAAQEGELRAYRESLQTKRVARGEPARDPESAYRIGKLCQRRREPATQR